jgi:hypothetical protein
MIEVKSAVDSQEEWDKWWNGVMATVRNDPASQWFYALRNPIVKEGRPVDIKQGMTLNGTFSFPPPDSERPPGAVRWQGVDNRGIHMWITADGNRMRGAPLAGATSWTTLVGVPKDLDFQPLTDLMQRYIANLGSVVAAANARFAPTE